MLKRIGHENMMDNMIRKHNETSLKFLCPSFVNIAMLA